MRLYPRSGPRTNNVGPEPKSAPMMAIALSALSQTLRHLPQQMHFALLPPWSRRRTSCHASSSYIIAGLRHQLLFATWIHTPTHFLKIPCIAAPRSATHLRAPSLPDLPSRVTFQSLSLSPPKFPEMIKLGCLKKGVLHTNRGVVASSLSTRCSM